MNLFEKLQMKMPEEDEINDVAYDDGATDANNDDVTVSYPFHFHQQLQYSQRHQTRFHQISSPQPFSNLCRNRKSRPKSTFSCLLMTSKYDNSERHQRKEVALSNFVDHHRHQLHYESVLTAKKSYLKSNNKCSNDDEKEEEGFMTSYLASELVSFPSFVESNESYNIERGKGESRTFDEGKENESRITTGNCFQHICAASAFSPATNNNKEENFFNPKELRRYYRLCHDFMQRRRGRLENEEKVEEVGNRSNFKLSGCSKSNCHTIKHPERNKNKEKKDFSSYSLKWAKMIAVLLQKVVFLLTFLSSFSTVIIATTTIPLASCQANSNFHLNSTSTGIGPQLGSNFFRVVNPSPTQQWSPILPSVADNLPDSSHSASKVVISNGGFSSHSSKTSSNISNVNTVKKSNDNDHENRRWNSGGSSINGGGWAVAIPPQHRNYPHQNDSSKSSKRMSSKIKTKNGKVSSSSSSPLVGAPFVRAHSTGFISLVDSDDRKTKGGLSSSSLTVDGLAGAGGKIMLAPQLVGGDELSQRLLKIGPCHCWNSTDDGHKREVECKCTGQDMTNVTGLLPSDIHRLTLEQAVNFTTLTSQDLKPYGNSLNELVLSDLQSFQTIKNGSFLGLKRLSTIYIYGAPALTEISDAVFNVYLPELKIIRITHSSLEVVPNLSKLHIKAKSALHMVELENNKISLVKPGSFQGMVTEDLALSYNNLKEIGPFAFNGSTIARLYLKGNPLKTLHSNSFVGIDSLRVLDLSETQITYLPTQGLTALEILRLQKVWTLSVIPSIYHFQELKEAWLTWPYHCCAFQYPETHDPAAFQRYKEYVRSVVNELCAKASANNATTTEIPKNNKNNNGIINAAADDNNDDEGRGFHRELNDPLNSQRQKRHLVRLREGMREQVYWNNNENTYHVRRIRRDSSFGGSNNVYINNGFSSDATGRRRQEEDYTSARVVVVNEPIMVVTSNPHNHIFESSFEERFPGMRKRRSVSGQHPRIAQQNRNVVDGSTHPRMAKRSDDDKLGEESERNGDVGKNTDGFHHPHVHHGGTNNNYGNSAVDGGENPSSHHHKENNPFENDDGFDIHFERMGHDDSFDPFIFNPDKSFAPILDPNDLEHESDITGKAPWGTFGHAEDGAGGEFDEDIGIFHPSVTPSPSVITLCGNVAVKKPPKISCHPLPDAFNPCEDIMGSIWLRGAVWVVVALALFGNTAVLVVLLLAPGRISVQRFLMANLSWADLCMGIYLLMVATQDLVSLGSYFNYAIEWQLGFGCKIAGFLTVFASELSVFTLAVITGERWYALTRAIHLTKRLTLLGASQLMALGWFMAILLAALPLIGVSSYSKTSICLPMEANSGGAVGYLIFLLLFNGLAFLLVACAYWQMYRAVAGHGGSGSGAAPAASSADTAIAKKMALLVFTDFACWAPVAFFGLTAVGGMPLIGVTDSKILLVFFYPLNACCNPYLYAILTKQYRRDLLLLLSRHGMCTKRAARYKTGAASTNNTMQTMQTVLRVGSMTETKVAGNNGNGRGSLLNGGRLSMAASVVEHSLIEEDNITVSGQKGVTRGKIIPTATTTGADATQKYKNNSPNLQNHSSASQMLTSSPSNDFRKPLSINKSPNSGDDDDDVFDLNGLSGRHIAETTFISIPLSASSGVGGGKSANGLPKKKAFGESAAAVFQNGDPAKDKLIQHHSHNNHNSNGKLSSASSPTSPPSSGGDKLITPENNKGTSSASSHLILSGIIKDVEQDDHEINETTPFCLVRN